MSSIHVPFERRVSFRLGRHGFHGDAEVAGWMSSGLAVATFSLTHLTTGKPGGEIDG